MKESDPHWLTSRRLNGIGISLFCIAFAGFAIEFASRNTTRDTINDLDKRIDAIAARVDAARDQPDPEAEIVAISAQLDDAARKLTDLRDAYDNPVSYANLFVLLYSGLIIVGSGFMMEGNVRRRHATDVADHH